MSTGATDGRFLRAAGIPTYGVSGLFGDPTDAARTAATSGCSSNRSTTARNFCTASSIASPTESSSLVSSGVRSVVVIGGSNVDLKSRTHERAILGTSNPGNTRITWGGVARNVAENLARLGARTTLVSAIGSDELGKQLLADTAAAGVDVSRVAIDAPATGTYSAVLSADGELVVGVASDGCSRSHHSGDYRPARIRHRGCEPRHRGLQSRDSHSRARHRDLQCARRASRRGPGERAEGRFDLPTRSLPVDASTR